MAVAAGRAGAVLSTQADAQPGEGTSDGWQPSEAQRERDAFRRRRTLRSGVVALLSSLVVLGLVGAALVTSPGWERVQQTYFDWDKAVSSFPAVLEGLWLNIRVMLVCWVLILLLSLTVAIVRTLRGPVSVCQRTRASSPIVSEPISSMPPMVASR